ncbi:MAG: hypothetical protein ABFC28_08925 [Rikenellaceae bacterium]
MDDEEYERSKVAWIKQTDYIRNRHEEAKRLEKTGKNEDAINIYLGLINYQQNEDSLKFNNFIEIERVIILFGKIGQFENQIAYLKEVIKKFPKHNDIDKWKIRLSKLIHKNINASTELQNPKNMVVLRTKISTLCESFLKYRDTLPEFNFYYDMPAGMETYTYLLLYKPFPLRYSSAYREYIRKFNSYISKAKIAENTNNYGYAIQVYSLLIEYGYESKEPFERLLIIYKKLKCKEKEIETLEKAIAFFKNLKEKQRNNVISHSKKFGVEDKTIEYLNEEHKILYYGGAFDLYNPYPIINLWKERLEKLKRNNDF